VDQNLLDSPTLRAAAATLLLSTGQPIRTRQLSEKLGISDRGARYLVSRLSTLLPIIFDDDAGAWRLLTDADFDA